MIGSIIGIIGILCGFIMVLGGLLEKDMPSIVVGIFFVLLNTVLCFFIRNNKEKNEMENVPQAIDVYRGKTTLQIVYKDTVPIDTIVVWK